MTAPVETKVVAYVPDLMDRSRLAAHVAEFAATPDALRVLAGDAQVVVLDLARPGALELGLALVDPQRRVVGFVPHVEEDLRARASAAGIEVWPRSRFFAGVGEAISPRC